MLFRIFLNISISKTIIPLIFNKTLIQITNNLKPPYPSRFSKFTSTKMIFNSSTVEQINFQKKT